MYTEKQQEGTAQATADKYPIDHSKNKKFRANPLSPLQLFNISFHPFPSQFINCMWKGC